MAADDTVEAGSIGRLPGRVVTLPQSIVRQSTVRPKPSGRAQPPVGEAMAAATVAAAITGLASLRTREGAVAA